MALISCETSIIIGNGMQNGTNNIKFSYKTHKKYWSLSTFTLCLLVIWRWWHQSIWRREWHYYFLTLWHTFDQKSPFKITALKIGIYIFVGFVARVEDVNNSWVYCDWIRILHIETETKWPPFSRRHFQVHFLEWKYINFDYDFTEVSFQGSN